MSLSLVPPDVFTIINCADINGPFIPLNWYAGTDNSGLWNWYRQAISTTELASEGTIDYLAVPGLFKLGFFNNCDVVRVIDSQYNNDVSGTNNIIEFQWNNPSWANNTIHSGAVLNVTADLNAVTITFDSNIMQSFARVDLAGAAGFLTIKNNTFMNGYQFITAMSFAVNVAGAGIQVISNLLQASISAVVNVDGTLSILQNIVYDSNNANTLNFNNARVNFVNNYVTGLCNITITGTPQIGVQGYDIVNNHFQGVTGTLAGAGMIIDRNHFHSQTALTITGTAKNITNNFVQTGILVNNGFSMQNSTLQNATTNLVADRVNAQKISYPNALP